MAICDITFPLNSALTTSKDEEVLKQNIRQLIFTMAGERIAEPQLGIGLQQYLWDGTPSSIELAQGPIRSQIAKYEKRIRTLQTRGKANRTQIELTIQGQYQNGPVEVKININPHIQG